MNDRPILVNDPLIQISVFIKEMTVTTKCFSANDKQFVQHSNTRDI